MAIPATENFTGSAGTLSSAKWTQQNSGNTVVVMYNGSGAAKGFFAGVQSAFWNADTFSLDQYVQATIKGGLASGTDAAFVSTRNNTSTDGSQIGLVFLVDGATGVNHTGIYTNGAGTLSQIYITSQATDFVTGDVMKMVVLGSTLEAYKNGVLVGFIPAQSWVGGTAPGVGIVGTNVTMDDWEAGNVSATGAVRQMRIQPVVVR